METWDSSQVVQPLAEKGGLYVIVTNWHFSRSFHFYFYCIDTCCYSPKSYFKHKLTLVLNHFAF